MKNANIDVVNIFLMLVSAVFAFFFPFELFLFSYAVLGPLHYLTEISWLHQRKYFTKVRFDYLLLVLAGVILFLLTIARGNVAESHFFTFTASVMFFAFFGSLVMATVTDKTTRIVLFILVAILSIFIRNSALLFVLFAIFLPTLIHVFIFTGAFILHGAMRSKSKYGYLSLLVFICCFLGLFLFTVDIHGFSVSAYIMSAYKSFQSVNLEVMNLMNIKNANVQYAIYSSPAGLSIMRFIAFAYTYHYLNWFSKTKVIKWHLVPRRELFVVIGIWVASIALYIYNYNVGLFALFFLSLLHVMLEFPLNHNTFIGLYKESKRVLTTPSSGASTKPVI